MMEGPEHIESYINQALLEFQKAGGYSETSLESMRKSLRTYLISDYNDEIQALTAHLQYEQATNAQINRDWYQNEVGKIRARFMMKVEQMCWMGR